MCHPSVASSWRLLRSPRILRGAGGEGLFAICSQVVPLWNGSPLPLHAHSLTHVTSGLLALPINATPTLLRETAWRKSPSFCSSLHISQPPLLMLHGWFWLPWRVGRGNEKEEGGRKSFWNCPGSASVSSLWYVYGQWEKITILQGGDMSLFLALFPTAHPPLKDVRGLQSTVSPPFLWNMVGMSPPVVLRWNSPREKHFQTARASGKSCHLAPRGWSCLVPFPLATIPNFSLFVETAISGTRHVHSSTRSQWPLALVLFLPKQGLFTNSPAKFIHQGYSFCCSEGNYWLKYTNSQRHTLIHSDGTSSLAHVNKVKCFPT